MYIISSGKKVESQLRQWEETFNNNENVFGKNPSLAAKNAVKRFKKEGKKKILEIGAGQGRDTIYFAQNGLKVFALDYSENAIKSIKNKGDKLNLTKFINIKKHNLKERLPFPNESFEACFSHMLYCMEFSSKELEFISSEIKRILKPNGLNIYTVRNIKDKHFKKGVHQGEYMYEMDGFIVHFFSEEKIKKLSKGFDILNISEFNEGRLPRKLYEVTLKKNSF